MRSLLLGVATLFILSACVVPVQIDREFTVTGTTVSDGQFTISLSDEVAAKKEKLAAIQDNDVQKQLITRAGNVLAGRKVRRTLKIDLEVTGFLYRTGAFNRGATVLQGLVTLSEHGEKLKSFKVNVSGKSKSGEKGFYSVADGLAHQIHWYGAKRYLEPKKKK